MHRGFVRLWRMSLDSPVWENPKLWRLWTYCLLRASYKPRQVLLSGQAVDLAPGELPFTLRNAARDTGLSFREVRTCLALAERLGLLARRTAGRCSVLGIPDWARLQHCLDEDLPAEPNRKTRAGKKPAKEQDPVPAGREFERFWAAYPRKVGRREAAAAFERLRLVLPPGEELLAVIERHKRSHQWQRDNGQFIPNPATWLRQGRWEDAPDAEPCALPGRRGDAVDPAELARELDQARKNARPMPESFARRFGIVRPAAAATG